jgi:hypothetical protein
MRIITGLLLLIVFMSCTSHKVTNDINSGWLTMADSFKYKNLNRFAIDTGFVESYHNREGVYQAFLTPKNKTLDSVLGTSQYYLYSWQQTDTPFTAFAVLVEGLGEALEMHYLIFGKTNKLISDFIVASHAGEPGGHQYSTESFFAAKDSLVTIKSRIFLVDQKTLRPLTHPIADTVITKQVISNGIFRLVAQDSILHTPHYIDEEGFITQKSIDKHHKDQKHSR